MIYQAQKYTNGEICLSPTDGIIAYTSWLQCIITIIINNYEIVQEIIFHAVDERKICSEPDETVYQALGYILQTIEEWWIDPNDLFFIINKLFKSNKHTTPTF